MNSSWIVLLLIFTGCLFFVSCGCMEGGDGEGSPENPEQCDGIHVIDQRALEKISLFNGRGTLTEIYSPSVLENLGIDAETDFSIGYVEIPAGNGTLPHYLLGSGEVIYVISGEAEAAIDGITHNLKNGSAVFIPAGSVQSVVNTGEEELIYLTSVQPYYQSGIDILIRGDTGNMSYKSHPEILISNPEENRKWEPSGGCIIYAVMNPGMLELSENEILPGYSIAYARISPGASIPPHILAESDELDYVIEGEIGIISGDMIYTVKKNQAALIPKGITREFKNNGDRTAVIISYVNPYWREETSVTVG